MSSFLNFKATAVGINTRARIGSHFTSFQAQALRVNQRAVDQMAQWAVEELDRHMRRPENARTGTLQRAILDPTTHRATRDGFRFLLADEMDAKVVNPLRPDDGTYWRAIEWGSTASVGRILPLEFLDARNRVIKPNGGRAQKEIDGRGNVGGMDRYRYSRHRNVKVSIRTRSGLKSFTARRRPTIMVRNPIRPYHYARAAVLRFQASDYAWYKDQLHREADRSGLKLVFIKGRS